jgi:hypothetical protein
MQNTVTGCNLRCASLWLALPEPDNLTRIFITAFQELQAMGMQFTGFKAKRLEIAEVDGLFPHCTAPSAGVKGENGRFAAPCLAKRLPSRSWRQCIL